MDKFTVRDGNGSVNVTASVDAYTNALNAWVADNDVATDNIRAAVDTVLDRHPGRVPMPALLTFVVQELGASPENFGAITKRVHAFIQAQVKNGNLFVLRGKGGGVSRQAPSPKAE